MLRTNLPRAVRHLRRHRGWRQADLASRSGVSRQVLSRIECGSLESVPIRTLDRLVAALGASADLTVRWQGADLDRLIDAGHARLVQETVSLLVSSGWEARVEVSFNHYGDRGRVDVLGLHRPTGTLLIGEVKTAIGDMQEMLGRLDVKARLARVLASTVEWPMPTRIVPTLVVAESRASRRIVATHDAVLARFELRGRQAVAWVRRPGSGQSPTGLLWFATVSHARGEGTKRLSRVRRPQPGPLAPSGRESGRIDVRRTG